MGGSGQTSSKLWDVSWKKDGMHGPRLSLGKVAVLNQRDVPGTLRAKAGGEERGLLLGPKIGNPNFQSSC